MAHNLTLHETIRSGIGQIAPGGEVVQYRVEGLPSTEQAHLGLTPYDEWRILRISNDMQGKWMGSYGTAELALEALVEELEAEGKM